MSPSVVLSLLLGSLYGLLWHACLGRRWGQLPLYWLISILGFFAGYALAVISGIQVLRLGTIPLLEATLGAVLALAAVWWLLGRRAARVIPGTE
jgi:drug/metabolite transporter (DMT)-like permease